MKKSILLLPGVLCLFLAVAGSVDSLVVYSTAMKKNIRCLVIKPDRYGQIKDKQRFPVVYLLHGYSGNQRQWLTNAPQLKQKVDELNLLIVCPDGGYGSWYFDSPVDKSIRYETFISSELVQFVESHYKVLPGKKFRAISGFSMGGHGALFLGVRHKETFGAAGSICGGVDIRPFPDSWDIKKYLGDTNCCLQNWEKYTVYNVIDSLRNKDLKLIIDCGTGDFFLQVNRNLHQKLLKMNIDHDYIERPGMHNSDYWRNSIDFQLLFFKKYFVEGGGN